MKNLYHQNNHRTVDFKFLIYIYKALRSCTGIPKKNKT